MKLKKCVSCGNYTMKENCPKCGDKTKDAHYKFIRKVATVFSEESQT